MSTGRAGVAGPRARASWWAGAAAFVVVALASAACSSAPEAVAPPPTTERPRATFTDPIDALRQAEEGARRERCLDVQVAYLAVQSVPLSLATGTSSAEAIEQFRRDVEDLRQKIPEQIKADYDVLARAYEVFLGKIDGVDIADLSKARENADRIRAALGSLDEPDVEAAKQRIEGYFQACSSQS